MAARGQLQHAAGALAAEHAQSTLRHNLMCPVPGYVSGKLITETCCYRTFQRVLIPPTGNGWMG